MKLYNKIKSLVADSSRSLKERVFIVLTLTAVAIAFIALVGDIICGENIVEILMLVLGVIVVPITTYFGVKYNRVDLATKLVSLAVIFVLMPVIFIFGGGIHGGGIIWLVFSYLYIGLVLSGRWRAAALFTLTLIIVVLFFLGYYHPELIVEHSREMSYLDVGLAVVEVGYVCFVMSWFQNLLFVTENQRAKDEKQKAEEMNKSQNRFFSSMSHEIRTPINSILGLNEIILRQDDASEEIRKDAANIQGAGRMLLSLINDILDFSKIEAGRMDIVPVNYSISALISEIVNMMWLRAEQKGLEFRVEVDPSIPSELYGDEVRIKQILVNLLNNAVKYTKEGSVTLHVEKEDEQEGQVVLLFSVVDTGMGIKQDAIPYLFDAFRRVDEEENARIEGTGLGLSIVKQLVTLMGGRVTVNSVYTQGSTFTVALRQKVTRIEAVGEIDLMGSGGTPESTRYTVEFTAPDVRILIVDDNEMNLEVERKLLVGTEIHVDTVTSGEDALALTLTERYDLILMDHLMPEMDGIECMQHIRKQVGGLNNRIPIIALTANAGSENRSLYARSGFEDYLVKPVSGRQLEEMLLQHLPESKVIRYDNSDMARLSLNTSRGYSRRVPVVVTGGSIIDLPKSILREHQIDTIPFLIRTEGRVWYDSLETDGNEVVRYMAEGVEFESDPPSVEEFEGFFARELKKAHNVIYISLASGACDEYANAMEAARAYENVRVFDSGVNSGGTGLIVLMAQRMAARGDTPERIMEELVNARDRINCTFMTDGAYFMRRNKVVSEGIARFIQTLNVRPFVRYFKDKFRVIGVSMGDIDRCYAHYIDNAIPRFAHPDRDLMFVIYSDLSEDQLRMIEARIRKRGGFKNVIFQKASSVLSLNVGAGILGLMYFEGGEYSYHLSALLAEEDEEEDDEDEAAAETDGLVTYQMLAEDSDVTEAESDDEPEELKWYERIDGIDGRKAMEHSGSEETLREVLMIFYETLGDKMNEIQKYYDTEDWEDYTIKVHALKSSARLVGADALADEALDLETAGKESRIDHIREHHGSFMEHLSKYNTIPDCLTHAGADGTSGNDDGEGDEDFDRFLMESIIEALRDGAAARDDDKIEETFRELEGFTFPAKEREFFSEFRKRFDLCDYEGMLTVLDEYAEAKGMK